MTDTTAAPEDASSSSSWISQSLQQAPPPDPLPTGWILRKSRSLPGTYYYYHQETGYTQWEEPKAALADAPKVAPEEVAAAIKKATAAKVEKQAPYEKEEVVEEPVAEPLQPPPTKRPKTDLKEVRVLHLLKKHKGSRRPASWRNPNITCSIEEATSELQELLSILKESQTPEELRATFEELARTESDCSSAKRGGDLGFFGRRKMQPAFEKASFALQIGELSDIVETSSGVHIVLRIG